jgi:hypothetical protein
MKLNYVANPTNFFAQKEHKPDKSVVNRKFPVSVFCDLLSQVRNFCESIYWAGCLLSS